MTLTDFYPTSQPMIHTMLKGIGPLDAAGPILEPSAGKGDICDHLAGRYRYGQRPDIDVIEIEPNLQHILRGKGYNVIHDDFLTLETSKRYGLIIANFPFSEGDKHLAKALQVLERSGGTLVCLVNAETIRNPYTSLRKAVIAALDRHGATVEYLPDQFVDAERPTGVEVALIRCTVPREPRTSILLDGLERAEEVWSAEDGPCAVAETDPVRSLIARFRLECEAGTRLIDEYRALKPLMLRDLPKPGAEQFNKPVIELSVNGDRYASSDPVNDYVQAIRRKYWAALIQGDRIRGIYTANVLKDLTDRLDELKDADFTEFNIRALLDELRQRVSGGVEAAILAMFDEFSRKYAWEKHGSNIHYYNGWKTNQAYRVNRKIILPMNGFASWGYSSKDRLDSYYIKDRLADMVKAFNYLAGDLDDISALVEQTLQVANDEGKTRSLDFHYFTATFYKKGTCHITFSDQRLLDKFNIYGAAKRKWLPPGYGRRAYRDMSPDEQSVVDDFQGEAAYAEVMADADYYLAGPHTLALAG